MFVKMLPSPAMAEVSDKLFQYGAHALVRAFQFVQKLAQVRDIYELIKLQAEFIEAHMEAMTELVRDLNERAASTAAGSRGAPKHTQVTVTLKNFSAALAKQHGLPTKQVDELLRDAIVSIAKHLKRGDRIRIAGLGRLQVRNRAARVGRNPATGQQIAIKASKTVAFRASKALSAEVAATP